MAEISIKNVSKVIKGNTVVDDVSLDIFPGVITGIKGINGSGKTMLLRLLCGLIRPTKGEISIDGKLLWKDISFPESTGILIENPAFLDSYTAFENLKLLADIKKKIGAAEIEDILERVSLNSGKKKFKTFSLGMKQRLGIAAAFMEQPEIILLDEPTNALDSDGVAMVKELLIDAKTRGALIVLTCHDFEILRELSDVIYLMQEGMLDTQSII